MPSRNGQSIQALKKKLEPVAKALRQSTNWVPFGGAKYMRITASKIAEIIGCHPTGVPHQMKRFADAGLIKIRKFKDCENNNRLNNYYLLVAEPGEREEIETNFGFDPIRNHLLKVAEQERLHNRGSKNSQWIKHLATR